MYDYFLYLFRYFKKTKNRELIKEYIKSITIGDWFVLYQMSKNLNKRFFYDFLIELANENSNYKIHPLVTVEDGDNLKNTSKSIGGSNCSCNDIKKRTNNLVPPTVPPLEEGPPPLMQGSPVNLKIHTA